MPGPPPKPPELRQRRNRVSTAARLSNGARRVPPLHKKQGGDPAEDWHPMTRAWWRETWRSPMADQFLKSDTHQLYILAELVDQFWRAPHADLAIEIRLQRQCFGLTPIDRRRLQWEVELEQPRRKPEPAKPPADAAPAVDPRAALRAVK